MGAIKTIIVPTDGSEQSARAAAHAATIAKALGAGIELVHVFPATASELLGMPVANAEIAGFQGIDESTFRRLWDDAAKESFQVAEKAVADSGVTVEKKQLSGQPAQAIIKHANAASDAMVIMGARGLGRFQEMLLGSVSNRVATGVKCPVTLVH